MNISLEQLDIFLAVAEHRSFSRAAEALYISHSTTSRNVAALEEQMGVQLLTRDNRSVQLTPAGDVLFREGVKLMRRVENVEDMVRSAGLGYGRSLMIASAQCMPKWLQECVRGYCHAHPEVRVGLLQRDFGEICKMVEIGEADLGVTTGGCLPENLGNIEKQCLSRSGICLLVGEGHPLYSRDELELDELFGQELICESSTGRFITPELRANNCVSLMPSVDSVILRVSTGTGVAIFPCLLGEAADANCKAISILSDMSEELVLIWRKGGQNPSLNSLLRLIRENLT